MLWKRAYFLQLSTETMHKHLLHIVSGLKIIYAMENVLSEFIWYMSSILEE